jgi:hypothetical protein
MPWIDPDDEILQTARDLARLAQFAYEKDEARLRMNLVRRFGRVDLLPLGLGFVAKSGREVVIALAGRRRQKGARSFGTSNPGKAAATPTLACSASFGAALQINLTRLASGDAWLTVEAG